MKTNLTDWHKELVNVDHLANHRECIDELEQIYLESEAANDRKMRIRTTWLLRYLKKIV